MMLRFVLSTVVMVLWLSAVGCGSDPAPSPAASACIPGATAICACPGATTGVQSCSTDGIFSPCACDGGTGGDRCIPGTSVACACASGGTGAQECGSDGAFAPCACTAEPDDDAGTDTDPGNDVTDSSDGTDAELPDTDDAAFDSNVDPDDADGSAPVFNDCGGTGPLAWEGLPASVGDDCGCGGTLTCGDTRTLDCTSSAPINACGGCALLDAPLGSACGECSNGTWACDGADALRCDGGTERTTCGGCEPLVGRPGDLCDADSGAGVWVCDGEDEVTCNGEGRNACGGTGLLDAPPGTVCGACGGGTWVCSGREDVICRNADRRTNECGGCAALEGEPTEACGCGGVWVCDGSDGDEVVCSGSTENICGGCEVLTNRPGDRCATGVFYCAGRTLLCGSVNPNECGGVDPLPADPGQPCGACGSGRWSCAGNNALICSGDLGEDRFNACRGCTRLTTNPGQPCGTCNSGRTTCAGTDATVCQNELPAAAFYHWPDFDNDGFGNGDENPTVLCSPLTRFVTNNQDCDDSRPFSYPGADELCDGRDNNCDGVGDELLSRSCYSAASETLDVGICEAGIQRCLSGSWSSCLNEVTPTTDACDSLDNDCDGTPDNGAFLATDVNNCGTCGRRCEAFNTTFACTSGNCNISACAETWYNSTGDPEDGCDCRAAAVETWTGSTATGNPNISVSPSADTIVVGGWVLDRDTGSIHALPSPPAGVSGVVSSALALDDGWTCAEYTGGRGVYSVRLGRWGATGLGSCAVATYTDGQLVEWVFDTSFRISGFTIWTSTGVLARTRTITSNTSLEVFRGSATDDQGYAYFISSDDDSNGVYLWTLAPGANSYSATSFAAASNDYLASPIRLLDGSVATVHSPSTNNCLDTSRFVRRRGTQSIPAVDLYIRAGCRDYLPSVFFPLFGENVVLAGSTAWRRRVTVATTTVVVTDSFSAEYRAEMSRGVFLTASGGLATPTSLAGPPLTGLRRFGPGTDAVWLGTAANGTTLSTVGTWWSTSTATGASQVLLGGTHSLGAHRLSSTRTLVGSYWASATGATSRIELRSLTGSAPQNDTVVASITGRILDAHLLDVRSNVATIVAVVGETGATSGALTQVQISLTTSTAPVVNTITTSLPWIRVQAARRADGGVNVLAISPVAAGESLRAFSYSPTFVATEPVELDRAASFTTAVLRNTADGIMAAWLARAGSLSSVRATAWPTTGSTFRVVTQFETTNAGATLAAVEPNSEGGLAFLAAGQVGTIAGLYAFSCASDASRVSPPSRSSLGTSVAYAPAARHGSLSPGVLLPITSDGTNLFRMGCGSP